MCGICGFNWADENLIQNMSESLRHRGPDMQGHRIVNNVSLGHARLSIIDLSERARQPMSNENDQVFALVNGEIYNFQELKAELVSRGHVFKSHTDSEAVVHAYEEWGPDCIKKFNGMFAFAIYDARRKLFMLARDHFGIKPLYYYHAGDKLIFASEIKAILAWSGLRREVDPQAYYQYLGYECVPHPRTLFKGIKKVPQAHYLLIEQNTNGLTQHRYWNLNFNPRYKQPGEAVEDLRAILKKAVKDRLVSDVPLGVFLSGGLDSTTVTALMRACGIENLKSFSIAYPDKTFSELEYANDMAAYYQTDHTVLMVEGLEMDDLEKSVYHLDEPMTDLSAVPLMLLCQRAKEDVTVVLSGEGGDEVFCGYDRFKAAQAAQYLEKIPGLPQILGKLAQKLPDQPQKKGAVNIFKRFVEGMNLPKDGEHLRWQYFLEPSLAQKLFKPEIRDQIEFDPFKPVRDVLALCNSRQRLDREVYADLNLTMADAVLMKADKMSMAGSLELRVPFLDQALVEFSATLPGWFKLKGFTTKYILRQAITGLVPDRIVNRGKQGYSLPVKNLLRGQLKSVMEELLTTSPVVLEYLNSKEVKRLMAEHLAGTHNHNHVLWALLNAALWHRRFMEV